MHLMAYKLSGLEAHGRGTAGRARVGVLLLAWALLLPCTFQQLPPQCQNFNRTYDASFIGPRQVLQAGNATIAYHRFGLSPNNSTAHEPLVMINGLGTTMYAWHPEMLRMLAADHDVVMFDNIGVGYSAALGIANATKISMPFMADTTMALIKGLNLSKPSILGQSLGGFVALTLAVRYGDALSSIVALSTSAGGPAGVFSPNATLESFLNFSQVLPLVLPRGSADPGLCEWIATAGAYAKYTPKDAPPQAIAAQWAGGAEYLNSSSTYNGLRRLRNKVIYIHGALDKLLPVKGAYIAAANTPASDVVVADNAGHSLAPVHPIETTSIIMDFLRRAKPLRAEAVALADYGILFSSRGI